MHVFFKDSNNLWHPSTLITDLLKNWVTEVVSFEVNDFIPDANQATWLKETCKVSQVASFPAF